MRFITSLFLVLALALCSSVAFATGTKIDGDVEIDVETGHVLTVAAGMRSEANTNIASIGKNVEIDGDYKADIKTGHVLTVAAGMGAKANTNIGSIGK